VSHAVETVREVAAPIADEWDELASRTGASPFVRPGWIRAWWHAFGSGSLEVLAVRRQGRLAGVLPLARRRGAMVSTTNWHTPEFAPPAEDEEALAELIRAALARASLRLDLSFLDEDSSALETCARVSEAEGYRTLARTIQRSPYLELRGDWEGYEGQLPSRLTSNYRRRRRLEEEGEVSVEVFDGSARLQDLLREGFEVEAAGSAGRTPILAHASTAGFYTEVAEWAAERGWFRLWFLRLGGTPIGFDYGLEHGGVYFDLKVGFDPSYRRFAPGVLLQRERLQHAFAARLRRYEFLGAADRHKLDWTGSVRARRRLQAFAPNVAGHVNKFAWQRGRPALKRLLRRSGA